MREFLKKFLSAALTAALMVSATLPARLCLAAEESAAENGSNMVIFDDLADFSVAAAHSEGLEIDVVTEENKYAFSGDDTHLIRVTSDAEWIEYDVPPGGYLVFHTAYSPNEEISHFTFEYTADGETYEKFSPIITTDSASGKWIPVHYSLKKLPDEAKKIKVTFGNVGGTPWSPCIENVELKTRGTNEIGFADCVGTKYYGATAKLKNLGLVSGYSATEFNPEGTITRAEFCSMTARLLNINGTVDPASFKRVFGDVDSDYWGAGAVYALYSMGVVNGDENGNFNPEDNITVQDAVKILVSSLGYTAMALDRGGYPAGFIGEASRLSLLDGLGDIGYAEMLKRGDAAMLMSNSLNVPIVTQTVYGESSQVYEYGTETILSRYHGITTVRGEITDVGHAGVYAESVVPEGRFTIGGESYSAGGFDLLPFLGMRGTAYLKEEKGSEPEAVYFEADSSISVTELSFNDYDRFEGGAVYYLDNGAERRINLSDEAKIIYNYRYLTRAGLIENGELPFKCGFMKIIKNSADSEYIMIRDYETYVLGGEAKLGGAITDKSSGAVSLDLENAELVTLYNDGERIEYDPEYHLNKNEVLNVAKSLDGTVADLRVSIDTAVGEVTRADSSGNEYMIGGRPYSASEYFLNSGRTLEPGAAEITAYLDINGNIAFADGAGRAERYGYLTAAASGADAFSSAVLLQVVTGNGTAETLRAVNSSRLNGERAALDRFGALGPQLVRFTSKDDGTVIAMRTATDVNAPSDDDIFTRSYVSESAKYYDTLSVFASKYQLDASTKVFIVPADREEIEKYKVTDRSALLTDTAYDVQIFDLSGEYKAGAVVITRGEDGGSIYNYSPICVVESSGIYLDESGTECLSLTVFENGERRGLKFGADGAADRTGSWISGYSERATRGGANPFSAGEVLQFAESDGVCSAFRMLLTKDVIENGKYYENNLADYGPLTADQYYSELYTAFGVVGNKFSDKIMIAPNDEYLRTVPLGGTVYVFNRSTHKLTAGTAADIEQSGQIFVQLRLGAPNITVVIR